MRLRLLCIGWVAWLLVNSAAAAERALSVTIYNDDLALVQDRRDIEVKDGRIVVDATRRTTLEGVWAGGDCIYGGKDLTVSAVEDGKQAARSIAAALSASRA